ncbi:HNH endonuclease family protein [uncultured Lactococcus sp.]|uniref:HNH endonuclease family protein n=1 Tax=uncultured Lactococcus sp. TaxID=167973 RepID=UPI0027DCF5EC|nr:HNH endonuclease family protein [uncultured Lactococcus sp.]
MSKLMALLVAASEKYLYIRNPAQYVDYKPKEELLIYKKLVDNVQLFITSQHHPLILAMLIKNEELREINTILRFLLNLGIRNFYFKENRANTIELSVANISNKYFLDELSVSDVKEKIDSLAIKDDELREAIIAKKINRSSEKGLKFILRETYNLIDLNKETSITDNLSGIHLEHILPQNPRQDSAWITEFPDDEEREFFTRKVGNTTLLLGKINSSVSNKDFVDKKDQYSTSHIPENNEKIVSSEKWGKKEINDRTEQLAVKIINYLQSLI